MKVRKGLLSSSSTTHGVVAIALALTLAATGAAVPIVASAAGVSVASAEALATAAAPSAVATSAPSTDASAASAATATAPSATPTPTVVPKAKKLTVRQKVAKAGRARGLSKAGVKALLWICKRESNFRPRAKSKSGTYHGLFQLSKGIVRGHPWQDPTWNTKRAIKYMKGRYGSVLKAKAFWLKHHWY